MTEGSETSPLVHAEFDFSIDDLVEVTMRHLRTDDTHRRLRRKGTISTAAMGGIAMFVMLSVLAIQPPLLVSGLSAATALAVGSLHHLRLDAIIARRLRGLVASQHGEGPHRCRVDLHRDRFTTTQLAGTVDVPWAQAAAIESIGGDIELRATKTLTMVRGRAFTSTAERDAFLATAQQLWRAAQGAGAPPTVS